MSKWTEAEIARAKYLLPDYPTPFRPRLIEARPAVFSFVFGIPSPEILWREMNVRHERSAGAAVIEMAAGDTTVASTPNRREREIPGGSSRFLGLPLRAEIRTLEGVFNRPGECLNRPGDDTP
jgi:hypothetical protein